MLVLGPLCSYTGGEDYFTHNAGGYDFHRDPEPNCHQSNCSQVAWEDKGKYSTIVFAEEAAIAREMKLIIEGGRRDQFIEPLDRVLTPLATSTRSVL